MAAVTVAMLAALVACIAVLVVRALKADKCTVPCPPSLPLIGHLMWFFNIEVDMLFQQIMRLLGGRPICQMRILNTPIVVAGSAAAVGELVRRKDLNDKSVLGYGMLHVLAKRGLIQLGGAEWKEHRTWLAPGFKKSVLDTFVADYNDVARDFVNDIARSLESGVDVDKLELHSAIAKPMTRAFVVTSLGTDWDSEAETMNITGFITEFFSLVMERVFNPFLWPDSIFNLTAKGKKVQQKKREIDAFTTRFVVQKREALKHVECTELETKRRTLMDIMIAAPENKEAMSEEAIQDEVKTSYAASVETSATAVCWALKILSMEPEVQARLHAEVDEVLGCATEISVEDLTKLKYMERFFKEVLRMYPPVPLIARQCYKKTELWGYTIPANTTVAMNLFAVHRDPEHWSDPERFDPDRFLPDIARDRHPYAYIPFSAGARNCIGGTYAMQLITTFLATTLRAFTVHPVDDGLVEVKNLSANMTYKVTSGLRGGFHVKFRPRSATATDAGDLRRPQTRPTASG